MNYRIKWLAYTFMYIPLLFAPHQAGVDFADKKRIERMNLGLAILVSILGIVLIAGAIYFMYLLAT